MISFFKHKEKKPDDDLMSIATIILDRLELILEGIVGMRKEIGQMVAEFKESSGMMNKYFEYEIKNFEKIQEFQDQPKTQYDDIY